MRILDGHGQAVSLAMVQLPLNSRRRTHQVIWHLRAGVTAAGTVGLVHAVHVEQCDATTMMRDSKDLDTW